MTQSLRELLLRRLNQAFWLLLLMALAGWGAWRFANLAAPTTVTMQIQPVDRTFQQFHLQSISSLDSSVTVLRLAVMTGESETVLLNLNEQIRQQSQEVSLLLASRKRDISSKPPVYQPVLLDQCVVFRTMLLQKASAHLLSHHIAEFQSQVRHLQHRVAGN